MTIMQERARGLAGGLDVRSAPGAGTGGQPPHPLVMTDDYRSTGGVLDTALTR